MKHLFTIRLLIVFMSICLFNNLTIAQISQEEAVDIVIEEVLEGNFESKAIYVSRTTLQYLDTIPVFYNDFDMIMPYQENWVVYIDMYPYANWFHETKYVAIEVESGEYTVCNSMSYPIDEYYYFQMAPRFLPEYKDYREYSTDFEYTGGEAFELNPDGFTDIVLYNDEQILIFENESGNVNCVDTINGRFIACIDMNSDGSSEIVYQQNNELKISYFFENEIYATTSIQNIFEFTDFAYGDVDGNNEIDFILADIYQEVILILYNPIDPQSFGLVEFDLEFNIEFLKCEDLDLNGRHDLILDSHVLYSMEEGLNDVYYDDWSFPDCIDVYDFDKDGDMDILFSWWADELIIVCENDGNQEFEKYSLGFDENVKFRDSKIIEINNDGVPFIVRVALNEEFFSTSHGLYLYNNEIFTNNTTAGEYYPIEYKGEFERTLTIGDFDGNGYDDIAVFRIDSRPNMIEENVGDIIFFYNDKNGALSADSLLAISSCNMKPSLHCFPNPFYNSLQIEVDCDWSKVEIFNSSSNLVYSASQINSHGNVIVWDGNSNNFVKCPPGIYIIRIICNEQVHQTKIIKL